MMEPTRHIQAVQASPLPLPGVSVILETGKTLHVAWNHQSLDEREWRRALDACWGEDERSAQWQHYTVVLDLRNRDPDDSYDPHAEVSLSFAVPSGCCRRLVPERSIAKLRRLAAQLFEVHGLRGAKSIPLSYLHISAALVG